MISRELRELCNDIYNQLDIAINTHYHFNLLKDMEERRSTYGELAINGLHNGQGRYEDYVVNLYVNREYFFRNLMQGSYGPVDLLAYEILNDNKIMGWPIVLTYDRCGESDHPPYKIFITMKGEDYVEKSTN